jgi:hypothetical protein
MDNIPEELRFRDVRKADKLIVKKESRQILPQNGTSFTQGSSGQSQIVFRLPNDEEHSVDLSTMWIVADLKVKGLNSSNFTADNCNYFNGADVAVGDFHFLTICDSIESIISKVAIYVNGSELERHDYYNYKETMLNEHHNNSNFSNSIGAGAMLMNLDPFEKARLLLANATGARTETNTVQVAFPLRWCGISNLRSLVPQYLLGGNSPIEIRIFLENANNVVCSGQFTSTTTAANIGWNNFVKSTSDFSYELNSVRLNVDYIQTSSTYSDSLRNYLSEGNQMTLPIETYYETQFNIATGSNGWVNHTISSQFSDVSAVFVAFFRSVEQSNVGFCGPDRMWKPPTLNEFRLMINGQPYPQVPIRFSGGNFLPEAEAYQYLMKAMCGNSTWEVMGNTNSTKKSTKLYAYNNQLNTSTGTPALAVGNLSFYNVESGSGLFYGKNRCIPLTDGATISTPANATGTVPSAVSNVPQQDSSLFGEKSYLFETPSSFVIGIDVSKSVYNDEYELLGQDLSKSSGLIQVQINFGGATTEQYTAVVLVKHKRVLSIGLNNSEVIY